MELQLLFSIIYRVCVSFESMDTTDFFLIIIFAGIFEEIGRYIFSFISFKKQGLTYVVYKALFLAVFAVIGMAIGYLILVS